jgi:hypothetical protein
MFITRYIELCNIKNIVCDIYGMLQFGAVLKFAKYDFVQRTSAVCNKCELEGTI